MYRPVSELDLSILYQGDVIENCPFFVIGEKLHFLKELDNNIFQVDGGNSPFSNQVNQAPLVVEARQTKIMVLSQTCDAQRREFVLIAPVYSLSQYLANGALTESNAGLLRKRRLNYWFYLPEFPGVQEEGLVDFQNMHYFSQKLLSNIMNQKKLSLSDWGIHHLAWALANYFGRPIENKTP